MPSAEEMEAAGFTPADYETDPVDVWPENWQAVTLFADLQTQWRVAGMGGLLGLDYNVLFKKLDRMRLNDEQYDQLESDVRVMEFEALATMSKPN